jgi:hypothetical protein
MKVTESEIEEALSETLKHAPHRPGGSKYKVSLMHIHFQADIAMQ